tara:strand:+ start:2307 stop:2528 length:222 start_codon:yes stop_codon:yes gene_type:complete
MSKRDNVWEKAFEEYYLKKTNNLDKDAKIFHLNGKIYSQEYLLQEIPYNKYRKHYDKNKTHMKYVKVLYELKK